MRSISCSNTLTMNVNASNIVTFCKISVVFVISDHVTNVDIYYIGQTKISCKNSYVKEREREREKLTYSINITITAYVLFV